ncbi:hypothetical protein, partial [Escherichia coli]|uniref:hypothetical protein n=1 Tax=Escherichia coli TaxID=562 RepID=UPI001954A915
NTYGTCIRYRVVRGLTVMEAIPPTFRIAARNDDLGSRRDVHASLRMGRCQPGLSHREPQTSHRVQCRWLR